MAPAILALDDDSGVLTLLNIALTNAGFDVTTCESIAAYRSTKATQDFDVFLIDGGLPDGDGFALAEELRKETQAGIILLTGQSADGDRDAGLAHGADDYVTKPFRLRDLAQRVQKVHEIASARRGRG